MAAPFFDANASLDTTREELKWLSRRLRRHKRAHDLADRVDPLLAEWPGLHAQQLDHWDAQLDAQVDVTLADEALDDAVDAFHADVLASVGNDRASARYRAWFKLPPNELKRFVLGAELETVRAWITMLDAETDASLTAHRPGFVARVKVADEAVAARAEADRRNAAFRAVGPYADYVGRVQQTREQVAAELERRRAHDTTGELPRDWANGFFRPRASQVSEEEKAARAAERERERQAREATEARRKELEANLKKTRADLAALDKPARRANKR